MSRKIRTQSPEPCPKCQGPRYRDINSNPICKPCVLEYNRIKYLGRKEQESQRRKKYYYENREQVIARTGRNAKSRDPRYSVYTDILQRIFNPKCKAFCNYGGKKPRPTKLCDRWAAKPRSVGYQNFCDDMGPRPPGGTIERYNLDGDYEPSNCGWETRKVQMNNTRRSRKYRETVPENSVVAMGNSKYLELSVFAEINKLPLPVAKYRYAQSWEAGHILSHDYDNRTIPYEHHCYNMTELSLLTDVPYAVLTCRIKKYGWSVEDALFTPCTKMKE